MPDPVSTSHDATQPRLRIWLWLSGTLFAGLLVIVALPSVSAVTGLMFQLAAIGLAVVGMVFGYLLIHQTNQRLSRLAEVADAIGKGNYQARTPDEGSDAIGALARTINHMAGRIQAAAGEEEARRSELADREAQLAEQNVQLKQEQERRANFGAFLTAINTVDIDRIGQHAVDYLVALAHAQFAVFYRWNDESATLQKLAANGLDGQVLARLAEQAPRTGVPMEVVQRREWISVADVDVDILPAMELGFGSARIREVVGIPVLFQRKALGVIMLATVRPLDDKARAAISNAIEALGGAFNNALTYQTVQRQAGHLEAANMELLEADRLRSEFVANMSHELRTPLNSVIGFSNLLSRNRNQSLNDKELGYVEKINRNGKHLLGLINDILDLSKIEAGRMELSPRPVNVMDLVAEAVEMLRPQADVKGLRLEVAGAMAEPLVLDPDKLKQVLINLLGNAIKFTEQGHVAIDVAMVDGGFEVQVADTGIGIPADRLQSIFEPFRQADSSTTREYGGTGLGLSISRAIVELMDGRISVISEPGQGTCFRVSLPAYTLEASETDQTDSSLATETPPHAAAGDGELAAVLKARALMLDADPQARRDTSEQLQALGLEVVFASNVGEIQDELQHGDVALLIVDPLEAGRDGWHTMTDLVTSTVQGRVPLVVASAFPDRRRAMAMGALDALSKPVSGEQWQRVLSGLKPAPRAAVPGGS